MDVFFVCFCSFFCDQSQNDKNMYLERVWTMKSVFGLCCCSLWMSLDWL